MTPPSWDMAYHEMKGLELSRSYLQSNFLLNFSKISTYYPPLYYLQEALALNIFPNSKFFVIFSNITAFFMLGYSTYRIALYFMDDLAAQICGVLTLLFPLVAWTSRLSLLDVPLAGWVAISGYLVLKSNFLQKKGWTILMGLTIAAGMLTKWTFMLFLSPLLLYAIVHNTYRQRAILNLAYAIIVGIPWILWWYLPNLKLLLERFNTVAELGVIEGDPGWATFLGWIYYPRCIASYYLFFPLTILLIYGIFLLKKKENRKRARNLRPMWWWLLGSLFLLTLIPAKDPRYIMPLVCPLAILLVFPWQKQGRWVYCIVSIALVQFLVISFNTPLSPIKIALFDLKKDSDYRSVRQEWVLFQTSYFDVAGPPRQEDWPYESILSKINSKGWVGFIPDTVRFNSATFSLYVLRENRHLKVVRLGQVDSPVQQLEHFSFVIGKSGSQGVSYNTRFNERIYSQLKKLGWPLLKTWNLPDKTQAFLWLNPTNLEK